MLNSGLCEAIVTSICMLLSVHNILHTVLGKAFDIVETFLIFQKKNQH